MNTKSILQISFIFSFLTVIVGAFLKIEHYPYAYLTIIVGLLFHLIFLIAGIYEVSKSKKIEVSEKFMWTVGFIFFGSVAGLVYLLSARKRIV